MTSFGVEICNKTHKLKLWPNSKTKIATKPKNSNCEEEEKYEKTKKKSYYDKTQTFKYWQKNKCD